MRQNEGQSKCAAVQHCRIASATDDFRCIHQSDCPRAVFQMKTISVCVSLMMNCWYLRLDVAQVALVSLVNVVPGTAAITATCCAAGRLSMPTFSLHTCPLFLRTMARQKEHGCGAWIFVCKCNPNLLKTPKL